MAQQVNGVNDLLNFIPVYLDIGQFLKLLPPANGFTYKLRQEHGALNLVYTNLTQATAFTYLNNPDTGFGPGLDQSAASAETLQITAGGVDISGSSPAFRSACLNNNGGVILIEARRGSAQPLVLVIEKSGATIAEIPLALSIVGRQKILLLLHGMNSNTSTWDTFVSAAFGGSATDIRDGEFRGPVPTPNAKGVYCYRLQFGHYDMIICLATATCGPGWSIP